MVRKNRAIGIEEKRVPIGLLLLMGHDFYLDNNRLKVRFLLFDLYDFYYSFNFEA